MYMCIYIYIYIYINDRLRPFGKSVLLVYFTSAYICSDR